MRRQVMIRQGCVDGFSDADPVITVFRHSICQAAC